MISESSGLEKVILERLLDLLGTPRGEFVISVLNDIADEKFLKVLFASIKNRESVESIIPLLESLIRFVPEEQLRNAFGALAEAYRWEFSVMMRSLFRRFSLPLRRNEVDFILGQMAVDAETAFGMIKPGGSLPFLLDIPDFVAFCTAYCKHIKKVSAHSIGVIFTVAITPLILRSMSDPWIEATKEAVLAVIQHACELNMTSKDALEFRADIHIINCHVLALLRDETYSTFLHWLVDNFARHFPRNLDLLASLIMRTETCVEDAWCGFDRHKADLRREDAFISVKFEIAGVAQEIKMAPETKNWVVMKRIAAKYGQSERMMQSYRQGKPLSPLFCTADSPVNAREGITVVWRQNCPMECPSLSKLLQIQPMLLEFLDSAECDETMHKPAAFLLAKLPTNPTDLEDCQSEERIIQRLQEDTLAKRRSYFLQALAKTLPNQDFPSVFPLLLKQITEKEITQDLLEMVNTDKVREYLTLDPNLVNALVDIFLHRDTERLIRESTLSFLARYLEAVPEIQDILIEHADFAFCAIFDGVFGGAGLFRAFSNKRRLFEIAADGLDKAIEAKQIQTCFSLLSAIMDETCDSKQLLAKMSHRLLDPQTPEVLTFCLKHLSFHPEAAVDYVEKLDQIFETAISRPPSGVLRSLYQLIAAISATDKSLRTREIELLKGALDFDTDRWSYVPTRSPSGPRGLRNLGMTCYMNSVFRVLFYTPAFRGLLFKCDSLSPCGIALRSLFIRLNLGSAPVVDTEPFARMWTEAENGRFSVGFQEDVVEFMQRLFARLPDEVTASFRGRLVTIIEGVSKDCRQEIEEVFYSLQIPVANSTFDSSMATLTVPRLLTGNDQYSHETMGRFDACKSTKIIELPKIFAIQLQWFDYNMRTCTRFKILAEFRFPWQFSASTYFPGHNQEYRFVGAIADSGHAEAGHYKAVIRKQGDCIVFDDSRSEEFTKRDVKRLLFGGESVFVDAEVASCAYVLFYHAVGPEDPDDKWAFDLELTESERDEIQAENHRYCAIQTMFTHETALAVISLSDFDLTWEYFIRVHCPAKQSDVSDQFGQILDRGLADPKNVAKVMDFLGGNLVGEILTNATEQVCSTLLAVLSRVIEIGPVESTMKFIKRVVDDLPGHLIHWRVLPLFARLIEVFVARHKTDFAAPVLAFLTQFYVRQTSTIPLQNVNLSIFFKLICDWPEFVSEGEVFDFVKNFGQKVVLSEANHFQFVRTVQQFCESLLPQFSAKLSNATICSLLGQASDYDRGASLLENRDTQPLVPLLTPETQLRFYRPLYIPLLIHQSPRVRFNAELNFVKLLPMYQGLTDYAPVEVLALDPDHRDHFPLLRPDRDVSDDVKKKVTEILQNYLELLDVIHRTHDGRLVSVIRIVHWLKSGLHHSELGNLGNILLALNRVPTDPQADLVEMLRLLSVCIPQDVIVCFFFEHQEECLEILKAGRRDSQMRLQFFFDAFRSPVILDVVFASSEYRDVLETMIRSEEAFTLDQNPGWAQNLRNKFLEVCWGFADLVLQILPVCRFLVAQEVTDSQAQVIATLLLCRAADPQVLRLCRSIIENHTFILSGELTRNCGRIWESFLLSDVGELIQIVQAFCAKCDDFAQLFVQNSMPVVYSPGALQRVSVVLKSLSDGEMKAEKMADIAIAVSDHLTEITEDAALDTMSKILESEDISVHSIWATLVFSQIMELDKIDAPSIKRFVTVYMKKVENSLEMFLDGFAEAIDHPENRGAFQKALSFLVVYFDALPDEHARYMESHILSDNLLFQWPEDLYDFLPYFLREIRD
jgi:hypothetical protein